MDVKIFKRLFIFLFILPLNAVQQQDDFIPIFNNNHNNNNNQNNHPNHNIPGHQIIDDNINFNQIITYPNPDHNGNSASFANGNNNNNNNNNGFQTFPLNIDNHNLPVGSFPNKTPQEGGPPGSAPPSGHINQPIAPLGPPPYPLPLGPPIGPPLDNNFVTFPNNIFTSHDIYNNNNNDLNPFHTIDSNYNNNINHIDNTVHFTDSYGNNNNIIIEDTVNNLNNNYNNNNNNPIGDSKLIFIYINKLKLSIFGV